VTGSAGRPDEGSRGSALYVYGIVRAGDEIGQFDAATQGVDASSPIALLREGELAAIVGEVPLADFGQDVVMERIRDPSWLEEKVRAHEAVLEAALPRAPLVPFRFGTIFADEEQVRRMLREHDHLRSTLDDLEGTFELGVKGFLEPERAAAEAAQPEQGEPASAGRSYLLRKQHDRRLAEARAELQMTLGTESHEVLAAAARDARANPLQRPEATGHSGDMFLNGAYLVEAAREGAFREALVGLESLYGESGATYELTGPWPPYNFVAAEGGL
jgi:Gas vesicle synthesis protein GvpL/GvpF